MTLEFARIAWRRYLERATDVKAIPMTEEQDALTKPVSPIASVALANVVVSVGRCF